MSNYGSASFDEIKYRGKTVGASMFAGYSYNERSMLSLGIVDPRIKEGTEVTLTWGEPDGGTKKTTVERHKQTKIRAIVSPVPYSRVAREPAPINALMPVFVARMAARPTSSERMRAICRC